MNLDEVRDPRTKSTGTTPAPLASKLVAVFVALGFWLLVFNSPALAGSLTKTFENNTGKDAYDLHIDYNAPVKDVVQTPETFSSVDDGSVVDLKDGTVAAGNSIKIKVTGEDGATDLKISKWWWTDKNHKRLGKVHDGCNASDGCINSDEADRFDGFDTATLSGVVTIEIKTDDGQQVNLTVPADVRSGETTSALIETQDSATLEGAVLDIGGKKHQLHNGVFTFVVPIAKTTLPIILQARTGREIAHRQIPVNKIPAQTDNVAPPRIGQTGQIVAIPTGKISKYDGIAGNTHVAFTPQSMPTAPINMAVIAESPRGAFVKIPTDAQTGAGMLMIEENGVSEQFKHNVLRVKLTAGKLLLNRGERTPLLVEVPENDMKGLVEDNYQVTVSVKNLSPSVVRFSSTYSDQITTKIPKNGIVNLGLTGIGAGAFTIHAFLKGVFGGGPSDPRDWVRKIAELKREAANQSQNTKNQEALRKNADSMDETADKDDNWDDKGQPKNKEKLRKFLQKEKEDLDKMQKRENEGSEAWNKIGKAKDAVDKAAKAAGVKLK